MTVAWLRHCYESRWFLFRDADNPNTWTKGRYYFSPPDSLHYPGFHHWGSRDWYDRNWENVQGLGEDLHFPHRHVSGEFDGQLPEQRPSGPLKCAAGGELISEAAQPGELFNGYPAECYIPAPPADALPPPQPEPPPSFAALADFDRASAFFRCQVQRLWARIIDWLYIDDAGSITSTLNDFFAQPATVQVHAAQGNLPAIVLVINPHYVIAVCDGTRNFQHLALQAFTSLGGPVDAGPYSTIPLWQTASQWVHDKIVAAGVNDTRPVFFAGHSYGAAAVLVLAARYRFWSATRVVKYLTFGTPKVGDSRLVELLGRCDGVSLANHNDAVCSVPPDRLTSAALVLVFPLIAFNLLAEWQRPPAMTMQANDGTLTPGPSMLLDFGALFGMLTTIVAGGEVGPILGHPIGEYERRISLRCPDAGWPVSIEVLDDLEEPDELGGGLVFAGGPGNWIGSGTLLLGGGDRTPAPDGGILFGGGDSPPVPNGGLIFGG